MAAWNVGMGLWQQIFPILAKIIFLLKLSFKSALKSSFFRFGVEIRFWSCKSLQFVEPMCAILLCFATQYLQIAVEWLYQVSFVVAAACVILLCFSAERCQSHCNSGVRDGNGVLAADFVDFGNDDFPFKIPFKKRFKIVVFLLWHRDPVLEL